MALKYLMNRRRRLCKTINKPVSLAFVKDAIITQMQPMFGSEIVDIDLGDVDADGNINITIFYRKETKTKKV